MLNLKCRALVRQGVARANRKQARYDLACLAEVFFSLWLFAKVKPGDEDVSTEEKDNKIIQVFERSAMTRILTFKHHASRLPRPPKPSLRRLRSKSLPRKALHRRLFSQS